MSKKLTTEQIQSIAKENNIPYAALRAVIEVECKGSGFNSDNTPVILFERHIFRQQLIANGKSTTKTGVMTRRSCTRVKAPRWETENSLHPCE